MCWLDIDQRICREDHNLIYSLLDMTVDNCIIQLHSGLVLRLTFYWGGIKMSYPALNSCKVVMTLTVVIGQNTEVSDDYIMHFL